MPKKSFVGDSAAGLEPKFIPELDGTFEVWPKEKGELGGFGSEFVGPWLKIEVAGAGDCGGREGVWPKLKRLLAGLSAAESDPKLILGDGGG